MTNNWAYNLDMLAQNGVLDFDAPSFVMNQNPRYIGRPSLPPSPYAGGIPPAPALNQPGIDEFKPQKQRIPQQEDKDNSVIKNPLWKKLLFGALAITGLVVLGYKFKSITSWFKNKFSGTNFKNTCSSAWNSIKTACSNGWKKFTGLFKKRP